MFSKDQIKRAIKAYGETEPNCYYLMKYKGDTIWEIYRAVTYLPEYPIKQSYFYDYDAYFITDKAGKPLDIRILGTKEYFSERLINAYYMSQRKTHDTLCISVYVMICDVRGFRFRKDYCSVLQHGEGRVLIDYRTKGNIFWA